MNFFNGEHYLRDAIDSVINQTYKDWEVIFWDNGSTEKSSEIAKLFGNRIQYFYTPTTYPFGKARNLAIQENI